ncbi:D-inositol-3-phosphate glycosyltransferase [Caballeronia sp. SBC1]|nr:D-inositol-3-phosphate glycosyltransferase [Caballeronia sp. SBC2]QIN61102.1 D-inositol-3-phosphate glycosyltransferase [Caballeronia sp. SBC1]
MLGAIQFETIKIHSEFTIVMKPLRILHSESSNGWGGQEHRTFKEMLALRERGHTLELVCVPGARLGERLGAEGFTVHTTAMRSGADVSAVARIRHILKQGRFDVLNTHSGRDSLLGGAAARLSGTPLIVRTRHLALAITSRATYTWLPHKVVAVSQSVMRYLVSAGVPQQDIVTIYTGIVKPQPVSRASSTLRAELGLGEDAVIAGTVAILRDKKGHPDLIRVAKRLIEQRPNLHFVFAGDGPLFDETRAYVHAQGLVDHIHLLGLRRDIPNVLAGFDLFVLPTHQEALGTSFIEAMAAGLPVIGTAVDGVPEVIDDGVNGLLVPPHDDQALAAALLRLVDSPDERRRMGAAGLQTTQTRFSVDTMASEMAAFYRSSLSERGVA